MIHELNTSYAPVASNSGLPSITINIGYTSDNMPIGVEIIGKQFDEASLIEIAFAYEKHFLPRISPVLPKASQLLSNFSIAEMNNLFTIIGKSTYDRILHDSDSDKLTPTIFKNLVIEEINRYYKNK